MTRPRSTRRYPRSRAARLAVPLAIPMALGLTLGIVLAVSGGGAQHTAIQQAAANATASASPSASGSASPSASPSGPLGVSFGGGTGPGQRQLRHHRPGAPADRRGPVHAVPAHRDRRGVAGRVRVHDGQLRQPGRVRPGHHPQPVDRPDLGLRAAGDHRRDQARGHPGPAPAAARVAGHDRLRVQRHQPDPGGATRNALREGNCTGGLGSSIFGQVSFCNGTQFFQAASWSERFGRLKVPRPAART